MEYLRNLSALRLFVGVVVARSGVHVGIGNSKFLTHVGTDPVGGVLLVHGWAVNLVLARTWHIEVLGTSVEFHAESELGLLLAHSIGLVGVARVREVEVAWDVVVRTWDSLVVVINLLLLLNVSNLGR